MALSAQTRPPCISTICRAMGGPRLVRSTPRAQAGAFSFALHCTHVATPRDPERAEMAAIWAEFHGATLRRADAMDRAVAALREGTLGDAEPGGKY